MIFIANKHLPFGELTYLIRAESIDEAAEIVIEKETNQNATISKKMFYEECERLFIGFEYPTGHSCTYRIEPMYFEDDEKIILAGGYEG